MNSNINRIKGQKAFTLAEVLITLGIIGVVAALTMPVVINNIKGVKLESRFKKTIRDFQNALYKVQYDEGLTIYGNIVSVNIANALIKQFKSPPATKVVRTDIIFGQIGNRSLSYKSYNGNAFDTSNLDDGTIVVNDEFIIFINNNNNYLTNQQFYIDINGFKEPNREGYDLFKFCLGENDKVYSCDTYTQRAITEKDYFKKLP